MDVKQHEIDAQIESAMQAMLRTGARGQCVVCWNQTEKGGWLGFHFEAGRKVGDIAFHRDGTRYEVLAVVGEPKPEGLSEDQRAAVTAFRDANGRAWKAKLGSLWMSGNYSRHGVDANQAALLQQVRNQFGPEWLAAYRPEVASDTGEAVLSRETVQNILGEHDIGVAGTAIQYYPTLEALVHTAASSRCWSLGETFVCAESPERFVIMCQVAPASCEMLTLTQNGFHDVLTAYRFAPDELAAQIRGYMDQPAAAPTPEPSCGASAPAPGF